MALRLVAAVVLAALAVAGYLMWIPVHRPNAAKLAVLARTAPVSGLRARPRTRVTSPEKSPIATVRRAAGATPGETGSYSVQWKGSKPVSSASLSLDVLPDREFAGSALVDARATALAQSALTSIGYGYGGKTRVPGIPGARGDYFLSAKSAKITKTTPRATVIVFRVGRVLAGVNVDAVGTAATRTARAVAAAEYRHLSVVGTDPALGETSVPVLATALYVLGALAVMALAQVLPAAVMSARRRRLEAAAAAERRARVSRGKKVVKRHAARGYAARVESRAHGRR